MVNFKIKIADTVLEINALQELTKVYCKDFLSDEKPEYTITMTFEDLENESSNSPDGKVYGTEEISALYRKIADLLVEKNILVFHGSSFRVGKDGYIVAARSGVGKSTHTRLLNKYLGDEFEYINDDKPLLEVKDNTATIYSSPWNGKERRGNNISAQLKAVLFLNRSNENMCRAIENLEEAYFKLICQIYLPKEKAKREKALKLIDKLVKSVNFYEINVNMDISAAKMTTERIIKHEA